MLQINELIQGADPIPALTYNPIFGGYGIMVELSIPRTRKRSQLKTSEEGDIDKLKALKASVLKEAKKIKLKVEEVPKPIEEVK